MSDVEALDYMSDAVHELHRNACIAWAKENNIQPPLPIGTMTTRGEITGIYEHDGAYYEVRQTGEPEGSSKRLLVRFEDARVA